MRNTSIYIKDIVAAVDSVGRFTEGMRDKLIHQYFGVKMELLWETVHNDLPRLRKPLLDILDNLNN